MYTLTTSDIATTYEIKSGQEGFLEGLALAARFLGVNYAITNGNGTEVSIQLTRVKEPTEDTFDFGKGYRFTLVSKDKIRIYYTEDAYVWKGAMAFGASHLKRDKNTFVTDIIDFTYAPGGQLVQAECKVSRDVLLYVSQVKDAKAYQEYHIVFNANTQSISFLQGKSSQATGKLSWFLHHRDFLDELKLEFSDSVLQFMTKAVLTAAAGLPDTLYVQPSDGGVSLSTNGVSLSSAELTASSGKAAVPAKDVFAVVGEDALTKDTFAEYFQDILS